MSRLLYTQFELSSCDPLPQVTEQIEPILQDDQVGHGGVLHRWLLVRREDPLLRNKTSEYGLPNDHNGSLTLVTLVSIIKNKLGSAHVPKFGKLVVKIDFSTSIS